MVALTGLSSGSYLEIDPKDVPASSEASIIVTNVSLGALASSSSQIGIAQADHDFTLLERNLQTAVETSTFVNKTVLVIVNYLDRDSRVGNMLEGTEMSLKDAYKQLNKEYSRGLEKTTPIDYLVLDPRCGHLPNAYKVKEIKKIAAFAGEFRSGTCLEMAASGFVRCINHHIPVEYFLIEPRNHAFLVFGREAGSKPADFRTWGAQAVVCDPWADRVYPASQMLQHMKVFIGTKKTHDSIETQFDGFSVQKYNTVLIAQSIE